jgi:hypothetical protein
MRTLVSFSQLRRVSNAAKMLGKVLRRGLSENVKRARSLAKFTSMEPHLNASVALTFLLVTRLQETHVTRPN